MPNLLLVAQHEFWRRVQKRSFLLGTLGIPLLIAFGIGFLILVSTREANAVPVGYVDEAGILNPAVVSEDSVSFRSFATKAEARQALLTEVIQAFFYLPVGYSQTTQQIDFYYEKERPGNSIVSDIESFIRDSLTQTLPTAAQQALAEEFTYTVRSADGTQTQSQDDWITFVIPFVAAAFFMFAVLNSSGYLLQAVADEKENRTIEVLVTSMSPEQLIGGKALGLLTVNLMQITIWIATVAVGLIIGAQFVPTLQTAAIPWVHLGVVALYFIPAFALLAGIMTAIGGIVPNFEQGQQIAGMLNLFFIAPLFFTGTILFNPDSPLVLFITLFPTTSFMTVALRWNTAAIPLWQLTTCWLLLVTTAAAAVWAAARIFRVGMLRYGQRLTLQRVMASLRPSKVSE